MPTTNTKQSAARARSTYTEDSATPGQALKVVAWQERQYSGSRWSDWYDCKPRKANEPLAEKSGGLPYEWRKLVTFDAANDLREQLDAEHADCMEQCRLLGISGSKELALQTQLFETRREVFAFSSRLSQALAEVTVLQAAQAEHLKPGTAGAWTPPEPKLLGNFYGIDTFAHTPEQMQEAYAAGAASKAPRWIPVAHELAAEQAKTDSTVTQEYLIWLESLHPVRNGVGGNEAWNAGAAWAKAQRLTVPCGPTLTDTERNALRRFCETCEDGEGYDLRPSMMQRLAQIGVVRHIHRGIYDLTEVGHQVIDFAAAQG